MSGGNGPKMPKGNGPKMPKGKPAQKKKPQLIKKGATVGAVAGITPQTWLIVGAVVLVVVLAVVLRK